MAKINTDGAHEVMRWVDLQIYSGRLLRSDGRILRHNGDGWVLAAKLRDGVTVERYVEKIKNLADMGLVIIGLTPPTITTMYKWSNNGVAKAIDGCRVEPDGTCPHGKPSWLIALGYI